MRSAAFRRFPFSHPAAQLYLSLTLNNVTVFPLASAQQSISLPPSSAAISQLVAQPSSFSHLAVQPLSTSLAFTLSSSAPLFHLAVVHLSPTQQRSLLPPSSATVVHLSSTHTTAAHPSSFTQQSTSFPPPSSAVLFSHLAAQLSSTSLSRTQQRIPPSPSPPLSHPAAQPHHCPHGVLIRPASSSFQTVVVSSKCRHRNSLLSTQQRVPICISRCSCSAAAAAQLSSVSRINVIIIYVYQRGG